jgi:anti-sigma regulatory factor (Ser/Thr protein kinase)
MQIAQYDSALSAPRDARARLTEVLRGTSGIDEVHVQNAAVIVSELVTNALRAGSTGVCIDLETGERYVRISVIDDAPGVPRPREAHDGAETGRGLQIVAALSAAWGVNRHADAKEVWADIARRAVG